jgi:endoglucanase
MHLRKITTQLLLIVIPCLASLSVFSQNYLSVQGNKLIDSDGQVVRLTGVNWFGFETSNLHVHGIWSRDTKSMLQQIKDQGFNVIRIPWCNKILEESATFNIDAYGTDPYTGISPMNEYESKLTKPLDLLDVIVDWCQENDMKIILDNHSRQPDGYMNELLWYTDKTSESKWIDDWVFLAKRYKDYDALIGMDLNNEPHGKYEQGATWGDSNPETDWNKAAERCGNAILAENPNVLILVEGIESYNDETYWWGGNLKGVADYPIQLDIPEKLLYSPHEYGPTVHNQSWFSASDFPDNMPAIWEDNFNFIHSQGISPLLIGEFGIRDQEGLDEIWFDALMEFMGQKGYSWTFWCWNPIREILVDF